MKAIQTKLDVSNLERLDKFSEFKNACPHSLEMLNKFLLHMPSGLYPSVFISDSGSFALGWEDRSLNSIELEFFRGHVVFFKEGLVDEELFDISTTEQLQAFIADNLE